MRAGMAAEPTNGGFHYQQQQLQQQQYQQQQQLLYQQQRQAGAAACASPVSQVSVAELAKIFGHRQRSASLQRQPQPQQQYQQIHQYPTMDKRPSQTQYPVSQRQHQQAPPASSPGRRGHEQRRTPVLLQCGDPRLRQSSGTGGGGGSGRWRSQESLSDAPAASVCDSSAGGGSSGGDGGLMYRSVQGEPPRLLPSGVPPLSQPTGAYAALAQSQSANFPSLILKPSAFRPVRVGPAGCYPAVVTPPSGDSGFVDGSSGGGGRYSQEPLQLHPGAAAAAAAAMDGDVSPAAASPSDSGLIVDYEGLLREKDSELAVLRRTMEQNESALVRVFEERQGELESRLRNELALNARLTPAVSLGNRRLRQSEQAISDLKLQSQQYLSELQSLKSRLRAAEAELRDRTARVRQLEGSLAASRDSLDAATHELRRVRGQQPPLAPGDDRGTAERACQTLPQSPTPAAAASGSDSAMETRQQLAAELAELRGQLRDQKVEFDRERAQWLEEKSQVLNYQKQLQMNYLQLTKRSQRLEAEAQQLSVDLETKEMYIMHLSSNGCSESSSTLHSQSGSQC